MPFGVVSRVGRGMGVLDGVMIVEREGTVLGVNLRCPIVTNGAFTLRTCYCWRGCIDIPLSYGLLDVRVDSQQVNTLECLWDAGRDAAVFVRVHCISTEFTARKHGGEKGVPFRLQIETYAAGTGRDVTGDDLLHCAACQIKVFKVSQTAR